MIHSMVAARGRLNYDELLMVQYRVRYRPSAVVGETKASPIHGF